MNGRALGLAVCVSIAMASPASATIYRWVDEEGVVNFSDNRWRFEAYRRRIGLDPELARTESPKPTPPTETRRSVPAPVPPDVASSPGESLALLVMRLSGLDHDAEVISSLAQADFERIRGSFASVEGARRLVAQVFEPGALRDNLERALGRQLDPVRAQSVLEWLRSPLARRLLDVEQDADSPERADERTAFVNELPSRPPAPGRLALLHRMERAGEISQTSAHLLATIAARLRQIVIPFVPRDALRAAPAVPAVADENARFQTMASLLFTYRDVKDADLARYVTFLESPSGRWFTQVVRVATEEAVRQPAALPAGPVAFTQRVRSR